MNIKLLLLVFVLKHANSIINPSSHRVCVYERENSCRSCARNLTDIGNISLPKDNFAIQFCSREFHLDSVLTIERSHSVTVQGMPTRLQCNYKSAGIHIHKVTDLTIRDITLVSCGKMHENAIRFRSSVYILSCTGILMERLSLIGSRGTGATMFNNDGAVKITNCTFEGSRDNGFAENLNQGGSGLHIVLSYCGPRKLAENCQPMPISYSSYLITKCSFENNYAGPQKDDATHLHEEDEVLAEGFKRGGGLSIILDENSTFNTIKVANCNFTQNIALWGGGLYIAVVGDATDNMVRVEKCIMYNNSCTYLSGGGASIGYQVSNVGNPQNNTIAFKNCSFQENKATIGGGATIYSSFSNKLKPNEIIFMGCNWTNNTAKLGAALDITPQVWKSYIHDLNTKIVFENCNFSSNHLLITKGNHQSHPKGAGAFLTNGYHIQFKGNTIFDSNSESAMHLTSTEVEFLSYSNTVFTNNKGFNGGAIQMVEFSALILNDDSSVLFTNNTAVSSGGAIYQNSYDIRDYFASQSCFIKYRGEKTVADRNITFIFQNNSVIESGLSEDFGENGHSIFTSTILPCCRFQNHTPDNYIDTFSNYIANFTFKDGSSYDISTFGKQVELTQTVKAIPGKRFKIPLITLNDLAKEVVYPYLVSVQNTPDSNVYNRG